jgi:protein gp37
VDDNVEGRQRRARVFCASLADWLDDEVPIEWLADLLKLIFETPNLDWLLLTKRPENWRERINGAMNRMFSDMCSKTLGDPETLPYTHREKVRDWLQVWIEQDVPPSNVWMGTTVENQEMADKRIPELLKIPAKVRFLSCEPLLSAVDFRLVPGFNKCGSSGSELTRNLWVICGGESGPRKRPFNVEWGYSLLAQCSNAGVPFFMKQIDKVQPIPDRLMVRQFPK